MVAILSSTFLNSSIEIIRALSLPAVLRTRITEAVGQRKFVPHCPPVIRLKEFSFREKRTAVVEITIACNPNKTAIDSAATAGKK
jgi:hypothetical protein